jgi:hypothetical protein
MDRFDGMSEHGRSLVFNAQHLWDVGAMKVKIEQADLLTMVGKGEREVYRNSGFSNAAFSAQHEDNVFRINLRFWGQSFWSTVWSILCLS